MCHTFSPADLCRNITCLNGGTCVKPSSTEATCQCQSGFNGSRCENDFDPPKFIVYQQFNLNEGTLVLEFSETINATSINFLALSIQSSFSSAVSNQVLDSSALLASSVSVISVQLSQGDINSIKLNQDLCTRADNCWVRISPGFIADVHSNVLAEENTLFPINFIPDSSPPEVDSITLDLNVGTLVLSFSEPVNASTFDFLNLTIHTPNDSVMVQQLDSFQFNNGSDQVLGLLLPQDLNQVKEAESGLLRYFITFGSLVLDTSNNPLTPVLNESNGTFLIPDVTRPKLDGFELDLEQGVLLLSFDEPVLPVGQLSEIAITSNRTIASQSAEDLLSVEYLFIMATGFSHEGGRRVVRIVLSVETLRVLKLSRTLASSDNTTFVSVNSTTFSDVYSNPVVPRPFSNAIPVSIDGLHSDTSPPQLVNSQLDLNTGMLCLSFDEVMDVQTVDPTMISLLSLPGPLQGPYPSPLSPEVDSTDQYVVCIPLSQDDSNALKLAWATSPFNMSLSFPRNLTLDIFGRVLSRGYEGENATMLQSVVPDSTSPLLLEFTIDLNRGNMTLSFDEFVDSASFDVVGVTLEDMGMEVLQLSNLSDLSSLSLSGDTIELSLASVQLHTLLWQLYNAGGSGASGGSGGSGGTSFATSLSANVSRGTITDLAGNGNDPITIEASSVTMDTTSPAIVSFSLDLNSNTLDLSFSEPIVTFNVSGISLLDQPAVNASRLQLDPATTVQAVDGSLDTVLQLMLTDSNVATLSSTNNTVAVSSESTFLIASPGIAEDVSGNALEGISAEGALPVTEYMQGGWWECDIPLYAMKVVPFSQNVF